MEKKDLQKDMAVFLSNECEYTERFFGWNEEMDKYKGTIQIIDSFSTHSNNHCRVGFYNTGFNWSVRDLKFIPKSPKPKSIRFDEKELCL
jgi:hypothetical protein